MDNNTENTSLFCDATSPFWKPSYNMAFHNEKGEVGRLDWNEGVLKFTGNADEAAKLLFEHLLKPYVDQYIEKELEKVKPLDPIYASERLLSQGFVVVTRVQWDSTHDQLEQARDTATKAVQARIADAEKITRLESELADLRARIKERLDHYESLISKGKGEWPNNNYVRDSTWDSWHGARCVLNSLWQAIKAGEGK